MEKMQIVVWIGQTIVEEEKWKLILQVIRIMLDARG
jgi:hypothetical protein